MDAISPFGLRLVSLEGSLLLLLDTNQLKPNDLRESLVYRIYQEIASHVGTTLTISRIAWIEHLHEFEVRVHDTMLRDRALGETDLSDLELVAHAASVRQIYEQEVISTVQLTDEYSRDEYAEAIRREIWRELPAKVEGKFAVGARDTLVWLDAKKSLKQGNDVVILSNDKSAFGHESILHAELTSELDQQESEHLHYFNSLRGYLEVLNVTEDRPVEESVAAQLIQQALYGVVNSPSTFVSLVSMINRRLDAGYAWNAGPPSINRADILGTLYRFSLEDHEYIGMKLDVNAGKHFTFSEFSAGVPRTESWSFEIDGTLTLFAKRIAGSEAYETEVLRWNVSDEQSVLIGPSGDRLSFSEARVRSYKTKLDELAESTE